MTSLVLNGACLVPIRTRQCRQPWERMQLGILYRYLQPLAQYVNFFCCVYSIWLLQQGPHRPFLTCWPLARQPRILIQISKAFFPCNLIRICERTPSQYLSYLEHSYQARARHVALHAEDWSRAAEISDFALTTSFRGSASDLANTALHKMKDA